MDIVMKRSAKKVIYALAEHIGIFPLLRRYNRYDITIVTFHGIVGDVENSLWRPLRSRVSVDDFERTIRLISKYYSFVTMDEAVAILRREQKPVKNAIVLTFDDGYQNNFSAAVPILKRLSVPAVFYVATGLIDNKNKYWFDRIDFALQNIRSEALPLYIAELDLLIDRHDRAFLSSKYDELRIKLKASIRCEEEFRSIVRSLTAILESASSAKLNDIEGDIWTNIVSWETLQQVSKDKKLSIGSHSVNHARMAFEEEHVMRQEAVESRKAIETMLGMPCKHFAYPNGVYNDQSRHQIAEAGYLSAVTSDWGLNRIDDDVLRLKRLYTPEKFEKYELLASLCGARRVVAKTWAWFKRNVGWRHV